MESYPAHARITSELPDKAGEQCERESRDHNLPESDLTGYPQIEQLIAFPVSTHHTGEHQPDVTGIHENRDQNHAGQQSRSFERSINIVDDHFQSDLDHQHSRLREQALLEYFSTLWNNTPARLNNFEEDESGYYRGYELTAGCSETTIYGLCNARDYLKGRTLIEDPDGNIELVPDGKETGKRYIYTNPLPRQSNPNAYTPIVFYSEDIHQSVIKAVHLLDLTTFYQEGKARYPGQCPITRNGDWPEEVPSHDYDKNDPLSGTIRIDDLTTLVRFFAARNYPIVIVLNLGTTWKGAYDDVQAVDKMLHELEEEFPWLWNRPIPDSNEGTDAEPLETRRGFWLHVDGTPGATFLPFIEMAFNKGLIDRKGPVFDFRNKSVMSIGCSLNTWAGTAQPHGMYMARDRYRLLPPNIATDTGAGNGTALDFNDYFSRMGYEDNMRRALEAVAMASWLEGELRMLEQELQHTFGPEVNLWIARSRLALSVRFRLVNPAISARQALGSVRLHVPVGPNRHQLRAYSHVSAMQPITREGIQMLIHDLRESAVEAWHNAFPPLDGTQPNPGSQRPAVSSRRARANYQITIR